jgi:lipoprotein-anchoring transpeptidase ErfK/SrfK
MPVSRRRLLTTMFSSVLLTGRDAVAAAAGSEPFPIKASEAKDVSYKFQRRAMAYETQEPPGTIVINPVHCFLYLILDGGMAMRYGVAVGKSTKAWSGEVTVKKMAEWPVWTPAPYHLEHMPSLAKWKDGMPGGPDNPLGARAMYLYKGEVDTINRIHGAAKPEWIGKKATAGCISLLNVDVVHLYSQVQVGTRVVMLG